MNRLATEASLYLRQHASDPVDWFPWGREALERARSEDRPILLSIGYAACHWCHVMASESFADPAIAEAMNAGFVSIKVDREERPDLDRIYQLAHQAITRQSGGWPLTMFLDPQDRLPFFGGTYFPPAPRHGLPDFATVLDSVLRLYREKRGVLREQNREMAAFLERMQAVAGNKPAPGPAAVAGAIERLAQHHDREWGGFGTAPKFPQPPTLRLLQVVPRHVDERLDRLAGSMRRLTLRMMVSGGLLDHLAGGFFRYCVDRAWTIPHFEKMLSDNALLLPLVAADARQAPDPTLAAAARATAGWLLRDMQDPDGGFFASIDADSEGGEGAYYVWTDEQFAAAVAPSDLDLARSAFALAGRPNFEDRAWHLQRRQTLPALANRISRRPEELEALVERSRAALLAARELRPAPVTDRRILTSWNALAIAGLARAGAYLEEESWIDAAARALARIERDCLREGRLRIAADSGLPAYLDDHAFLLAASLTVLEFRWDDRWLALGKLLAELLLTRFEDPDGGGFYFTPDDHETLIQRPRGFADDALPNGNAAAAVGLLRLGHLVGDARYLDAAGRVFSAAAGEVAGAPHACSSLLAALCEWERPPPQLLLRGEAASLKIEPGGGLRCYRIPDDSVLAERYPLHGTFTAYLCDGVRCGPPIRTPAALAASLVDLT